MSTKARVSFKDRLRSRSHYLQISVVRKSQGRSHHLGYSPGADKPGDSANHRNGVSGKTVLTDDGPLRIEVPRDRVGSFEPVLIPKHERRFTGFDDKIVAMYARGMTVREIQGFLAEQYGTEVSPEFISSVTDAVMAEAGLFDDVGFLDAESRLRVVPNWPDSERFPLNRPGETIQPHWRAQYRLGQFLCREIHHAPKVDMLDRWYQ